MKLNYETISLNVIKTRGAIGLSQDTFAILCGFSRTTLSDIENKKAIPTLKTLTKIISLTNISLDKLNNINYKPPLNFREKLQKLYSSDIEKSVLLNKEPSIPYIIEFKILHTDFFNKYRERGEIIDFIQNKYGWDVNPNTLSTALRRMTDLLIIEPHPTKKSSFIYKRK